MLPVFCKTHPTAVAAMGSERASSVLPIKISAQDTTRSYITEGFRREASQMLPIFVLVLLCSLYFPQFFSRTWVSERCDVIDLTAVYGKADALSPVDLSAHVSFLPPQLQEVYRFTEEFLGDLYHAVKNAVVNEHTGRKQLMVTAFDQGQLTITKNLFCSSREVGIPENFHIFVALDEVALTEFFRMNPSTLFLNVSGRNYAYHEFTKVKLFIQLQLLIWNVESICCDTDVVLLKDPRELFRNGTDMEMSIEDFGCDFPERERWWDLNVGFMRVVPSGKAIELHKKWLSDSLKRMHVIDQKALHRLFRKSRLVKREGSALCLDISGVIGETKDDRCFVVHAYDPIDVQNGIMMWRFERYYSVVAYQRNISKPYVSHLAWIRAKRKIRFLKFKRLWFLESDLFTCRIRRGFYNKWSNVDLSDIGSVTC
jgi:hypothetical protein